MASYMVVLGPSGDFAVEVQSLAQVERIGGFKTEAEAKQWMITRQREAEAGGHRARTPDST